MGDVNDYALKTYRYLRMAIVAMVFALLISIGIEYAVTGELLAAISGYYYTPVNPLFVGALIMIGVCLIAIRGETTFEEVVLNLSGIMAPVVALVPTSFPRPRDYDETRLYEPPVDLLTSNTVPAMVAASAAALLLTMALAARFQRQRLRPERVENTTRIGFIVALAAVVLLLFVHSRYGPLWTHNTAAILTFAGLWAVATASAVREVGTSSQDSWKAGLGGSLVVLGGALVVAGVWQMIDGGSTAWVAAVGAVLIAVALFVASLREGVGLYFGVLGAGNGYLQSYLLIAIWMLAVGPIVASALGGTDHQAFWIEVVELIPFGLFWVVQTIERWNDGVVMTAR